MGARKRKPSAAAWQRPHVGPEELQRRRAEGLCLGCGASWNRQEIGRDGHPTGLYEPLCKGCVDSKQFRQKKIRPQPLRERIKEGIANLDRILAEPEQ